MKRILAGVALALALLGSWFLSRDDGPGVPLRDASFAGSTTEESGGGAGVIARSTPEREDGRELVRADAAEASVPPGVTFVFEDGTPAAGLAFYNTDSSNFPGLRLWAGKPKWQGLLGAAGELSDWKEREGELLCIRLSADSFQTVHVGDAAGRRKLTRARSQGFRLGAPRADAWAEIEIQLRGFDRLHDWTIVSAFEDERHLADNFTLSAKDVADELVVAYASIRVVPSATTTVELPAGTYWIGLKGCTFGFDFDGVEIRLSGEPFTVQLRAVPLTHVVLPRDGNGAPIRPASERVVERNVDPRFAESEGEIEVPFEVDGDVMRVAQTYERSRDAEYTTYALRIRWSNHKTTTTPFGAWDELLHDLTPELR